MPFPLIIPFLIKGAAIVVKTLIVEKKVAVATKAVVIATKTYGVAAVATTTGAVLMTIGGVSWTNERFNDAKECYELWEADDLHGMVKKMASLSSKLISIQSNPHTLIHSTGEILKANGFDNQKVLQFVKDLSDSVDDIMNETNK